MFVKLPSPIENLRVRQTVAICHDFYTFEGCR